MWITRRYNDGGRIDSRTVYYNGKRWTDHKIPAGQVHEVAFGIEYPSPERHFTSVFTSNDKRYPRAVH